ncbi:MAG: DUF5814 domain-containing protein [Methanosphaera sp.]|nr:DUF5814 domain-containing protein [Methanosphaera sp.]
MIIISPTKKKAKIYVSSNKSKSMVSSIGSFSVKIQKNSIRLNNVNVRKSNKKRQINKEEFADFLKNDDVWITNNFEVYERYLTENDIEYSIKMICPECLKKHAITNLSKKPSYEYHGKRLCYDCAKEEVEQLAYYEGYQEDSVDHFIKILKNRKSVSDVYSFITNNSNMVKNKKFTLYDRIESNESQFAEISIDEVDIPEVVKGILKPRIDHLLPVQILALNSGLLYNENMLVVSQTASGKTLIAELTGIKKALQRRKFVYLSPLVALANQKYRYFEELYSPLGLNVVIKVGSNKINAEDELKIIEKPIDNADVIVATYEGLDSILRSGRSDLLNDLGVVVIDEIHMLENRDRGSRLHGLINRLMLLYPQSQLIGLSATIHNPKELAKKFNMKLVEYDKRPVTLERHIVGVENNEKKLELISKLCKDEFENTSPLGYRGQTIIFTDSRRKTSQIAYQLEKNDISAASYHAGLSYANKVDIEVKYANQEISTVVTTAALAAGVDFPASQVIFDSLHMGKDWLSSNEFHQMMGRAGRPSYQDIGKIYVFFELGKYYQYTSEEKVAYSLLKSTVTDIKVKYNMDDVYEQVLADISSMGNVDCEFLENKYNNMNMEMFFNDAIDELMELNMIEHDKQIDKYYVTSYGRAVSQSFLRIYEAELIRTNITSDPIDLVTQLEYLSNVYLSNRYLKSLKNFSWHYVSTRLFSDSNKELINNPYVLDCFSQKDQKFIIKLLHDFKGNCDDVYCDCLEMNISKHIINRRMDSLSPSEISSEFKKEYDINIYSGDIFNYLDQVIRYLEAIERISKVFDIISVSDECKKIIRLIEG